MEEEKLNMNNNLNIKKISLYTPKNTVKNVGENLTFKKQSPSILNRDRYIDSETVEINLIKDNFELNKKNVNEKSGTIHLDEPLTLKEKENVIEFNDNFDDCFSNIHSPKKKSSSKKEINDATSKKKKVSEFEASNTSKKLLQTKSKEAYKHHRKKSSFFNSEDLRVSKQENFRIVEEKSINKNLFNMFAINSNKSSHMIDFGDEKHFNNNDNSLVKISDSKSEISHNNQQHETLTSNLTSMISFINNNNNVNGGNGNTNNNIFHNSSNNKIVSNVDVFDFDFKDSPLQIRHQHEHTHQNYASYDARANLNTNINNNFVISQPNKFDANVENTMTKKTRSLDLFSISNQVNINIIYNNKKIEDKTRVRYLINLEYLSSSWPF